jgi:phosphatidylglycerol:prolipoprotein diacylglycerol transferase
MLFAFSLQSPGPIVFEIGPFVLRWYGLLIEIGPFVLRWYGLLIATAVLLGATLSQYLAKRRKVNPDLLADLAIWLVIAAIPFARLYYVLFQWQEYAQRPGDIIAIWKGGIAIHGAMIGGILATLIFARLKKIPVWQLLDLVVPSLALGQAIGRWGNFFNSEAFGSPTNLPWKLFIGPSNRPPEYLAFDYFHPTFLYESLWNLMVLAILLYLFFWGLKRPDRLKIGTLTLVYFIAYSIGRFWIEGLRTDSLMLGPLRIAQVVSSVALAIGIFGLVWLYRFKRPLPDVVSPPSVAD